MQRLTVTINRALYEELLVAANETECDMGTRAGSRPSPEMYAAEIIESYMASRRLTAMNDFIEDQLRIQGVIQ